MRKLRLVCLVLAVVAALVGQINVFAGLALCVIDCILMLFIWSKT